MYLRAFNRISQKNEAIYAHMCSGPPVQGVRLDPHRTLSGGDQAPPSNRWGSDPQLEKNRIFKYFFSLKKVLAFFFFVKL